MTEIRIAQKPDWDYFFTWAASEGWRVPQVERQLFAGPWASYAYALLEDEDCCALATAVPHQHSGWIGNLIVPAEQRGKGYGTSLFSAVLDKLLDQGMASVWLTASDLGSPIYEKFGFVNVGTIERWVLPASNRKYSHKDVADEPVSHLPQADRLAWGEDRATLLAALGKVGRVFSRNSACALLQMAEDVQVIGPWYADATDSHDNRELLKQVVATADSTVELVADVLATPAMRQVFADAGFACAGQTALMTYGDISEIDLKSMVSLASLGSVG